MKQNIADMDTMMLFDEVVEAHENMLLSKLADAVAECRTADKMAAVLSEDGEVGLLRLLEIWAGMQDGKGMAVLEGSPAHLLADVLAAQEGNPCHTHIPSDYAVRMTVN